jgi:hypothetical protein
MNPIEIFGRSRMGDVVLINCIAQLILFDIYLELLNSMKKLWAFCQAYTNHQEVNCRLYII